MSKLSDFGGGVKSEPSPEDRVKIELSKWFENNDADVYWEKRPSYGYPTFRTQTTERPDLLVVGGHHTYAIEVKQPDGAGDVYSGAVQTFRYWRRFCIDNTDEYYRAAGDRHLPDAFLLATKWAPDGRLLARYDTQSDVRPLPIHHERRMAWADPPVHFLPDWEFAVAETVTRILWRLAEAENAELPHDAPCGIGALLSSRNDGPKPDVPDEDEPGPFEQADMPEPMAIFKSFSGSGSGVACQNWRCL